MSLPASLEHGPEYQPQKRLLTPLLPKRTYPIPSPTDRAEYPEKHASLFNRTFFWWVISNLNVGYFRTLTENDLYQLSDNYKVEPAVEKFERYFQEHLRISREKNPDKADEPLQGYSRWRIIYVVILTFKKECALSMIFACINATILGVTPIISKGLTNYVEQKVVKHTLVGPGLGWAFGFAGSVLIASISINQFLYLAFTVGVQIKAVLTDAILRKAFKLSPEARNKFPNSKITSIISTDLNRIQVATVDLPFLFVIPIPLIITLVFLIVNLRVSAVIGVACLIVFFVFTTFAAAKLYSYRSSLSELTDARVSITSEVIHTLKMIKLYSWEIPYLSNVIKARSQEIKVLLKIQTLRNILEAVSLCLSGLASMFTFVILFVIDGATKSAAVTFSALSAFEILAGSLVFVPQGIARGADLLMGLKRVFEFLLAEESDDIPPNYYFHEDKLNAVTLDNASFEWENFAEGEEEPFKLSEINLKIQKGEFIIISGSIGSGKSSLLNAMSGAMKCTSGFVNVDGALAFCDQPWVQNTTIKENILFGSKFDAERYDKVVFACALQGDFDNFPGGDLTEVGERGITLSGGQKARINLARAVYVESDIVMLDDVLSAVDAKVGKHIVNHCFMDLLKGKTIILATHQLALADSASRTVFLNSNNTISVGTKEELLNSNFQFKKLLSFSQHEESEEVEPEDREELETIFDSDEDFGEEYIVGTVNDEAKGKIVEDEEMAVNGVKFSIYKQYVKYGAEMGIFLYFLIFTFLVVVTGFLLVFGNTWLSFWVTDKFYRSSGFYIGLYVLFNIMLVLSVATLFILIATLCSQSSKNLNIAAIDKLLHTPMAFLDITPIGRVLNRFTKDTDALDNEISEMYKYMVYSVWNLGGTVVLVVIYLPVIIAALPIIALAFLFLVNYYIASTRQIKRIESIKRSYLFTNINESLGGMSTIKFYKSQERFISVNKKLINGMNEASILNYANQCWLALGLEMLSLVITLLVSLLCVTEAFHISAASVGLLINYTATMSSNASLLIRMYSRLENAMNSTERICEYANDLPQEADYTIQATQPPASWPSGGLIEFKHVSMSYRPGLPLVLKDINFTTAPGEKIGICGRTGAGKSSITTALYRLSELDLGEIYIDGVDISKIGLKDLRSHLSIIPQDPVLFNGSIRKNLDPFDEYSDDKIWDALRRSGLIMDEQLAEVKEQLSEIDQLHKFHIKQEVVDSGSNFSLGEKQLIAFARALLRDTKILIMDEATSLVDYQTDSKIQQTIANEFAHCTILCIAHRLKTIVNYDRILTLDKGEVSAIDTPFNLYNDETSLFRQLCEKSGINARDFASKLIEYDLSESKETTP
ncbi:P-loop containing nucleoside triphosphate hydrolase protein [Suhomyces tanzawaensis NRRL Y-17324]|uniref:p-loop containing nucleoside triphosphate hydrolase protein n=1 Tax=Suhomyces tanzawaensis NRRL Y-17324 TaxID=984487 RepID=A0A1E4SKT4_9ASCO|nr:P-loop containing nucleoside triphosphate hydrolase protein [Suhomyces tanzawaensis NRRL Y-17324]ODV80114.1 P-loop containing nucleoside triphosphate hydrolase protein [Suhomyces tanzawaensis NRRL Y-17324]